MLPMVSAALTAERALQRLSIPEVAKIAGVAMDDVFDAENFLEDVDPVAVQLISIVLAVNLTKSNGIV